MSTLKENLKLRIRAGIACIERDGATGDAATLKAILPQLDEAGPIGLDTLKLAHRTLGAIVFAPQRAILESLRTDRDGEPIEDYIDGHGNVYQI